MSEQSTGYWYRIMGNNLPRGCAAAWPDNVKAARRAIDKDAKEFRIYGYKTRQLARFGKQTDAIGEHGRVS